MTAVPVYVIGSKEYVKGICTSDRTLDTQPVELKINGAWVAATGVGAAGLTRTYRTASIVDFATAPLGYQQIFYRFTDTPEVPVMLAGNILVIPDDAAAGAALPDVILDGGGP